MSQVPSPVVLVPTSPGVARSLIIYGALATFARRACCALTEIFLGHRFDDAIDAEELQGWLVLELDQPQ